MYHIPSGPKLLFSKLQEEFLSIFSVLHPHFTRQYTRLPWSHFMGMRLYCQLSRRWWECSPHVSCSHPILETHEVRFMPSQYENHSMCRPSTPGVHKGKPHICPLAETQRGSRTLIPKVWLYVRDEACAGPRHHILGPLHELSYAICRLQMEDA